MPSVVDPKSVVPRTGTIYPARYAGEVKGREKRPLGDAFGLTQFGVNLTTLPPGCWSSHRHWHEREDELIYVLQGEVILIDDQGEHLLSEGMCAGFKAGVPNAHQLINRTDKPVLILEVGTRSPEERAHYAEADMMAAKTGGGGWTITRRDGTAFGDRE